MPEVVGKSESSAAACYMRSESLLAGQERAEPRARSEDFPSEAVMEQLGKTSPREKSEIHL